MKRGTIKPKSVFEILLNYLKNCWNKFFKNLAWLIQKNEDKTLINNIKNEKEYKPTCAVDNKKIIRI